MKGKWLTRLAALCLTLVVAVGAALPASAAYDMPITTSMQDETVYLVDIDEGTVLLDQNGDKSRYIASLTKMITALLVLESGEDLQKTIVVPDRLTQEFKDIQNANGSGMNLKIGEEIRMIDLLYGVLVASANDATSTLADYFGNGSTAAFVDKMNQRAAELGCTDTVFSCVHGLYDQGNVSTAQDLVKIATACYQNPQYMEIANTVQYTVPANNKHTEPRELKPSNLMLDQQSGYYYEGVSGIKTGFTTLAGRCYITSLSHEGHNYMLVILGAKKEKKGENFYVYQEAAALLDWLRSRYYDRTLISKGDMVGEVALRGCDESSTAALHAANELVVNAYADAKLEVKMEVAEELKAPLHKGEEVGTAVLTLDGKEVGRVPLVTQIEYESAMLKGGLQALALVPAVLVVVAALGYITGQLSHSQVNWAVLKNFSGASKKKRRRSKTYTH